MYQIVLVNQKYHLRSYPNKNINKKKNLIPTAKCQLDLWSTTACISIWKRQVACHNITDRNDTSICSGRHWLHPRPHKPIHYSTMYILIQKCLLAAQIQFISFNKTVLNTMLNVESPMAQTSPLTQYWETIFITWLILTASAFSQDSNNAGLHLSIF